MAIPMRVVTPSEPTRERGRGNENGRNGPRREHDRGHAHRHARMGMIMVVHARILTVPIVHPPDVP